MSCSSTPRSQYVQSINISGVSGATWRSRMSWLKVSGTKECSLGIQWILLLSLSKRDWIKLNFSLTPEVSDWVWSNWRYAAYLVLWSYVHKRGSSCIRVFRVWIRLCVVHWWTRRQSFRGQPGIATGITSLRRRRRWRCQRLVFMFAHYILPEGMRGSCISFIFFTAQSRSLVWSSIRLAYRWSALWRWWSQTRQSTVVRWSPTFLPVSDWHSTIVYLTVRLQLLDLQQSEPRESKPLRVDIGLELREVVATNLPDIKALWSKNTEKEAAINKDVPAGICNVCFTRDQMKQSHF